MGVFNDDNSDEGGGCGFLGNLFKNLNKTSEQNLAEQAQCVKESEALEHTNRTDGSKYKQHVQLRMLKEDSQMDQIFALYRSVKDKDYEKLRFLVTECKVDINHCFETENYIKVNYRGWRPVHFMCKNGDQRGLEAALALGADVTARTPDNNTALHICWKYGHQGCVEYLL